MTTYNELRTINVNEKVEKKEGLSYLSWAWAWDTFKQKCPDATYEIVKSSEGLPYFESHAGAMVYTKVTANGETHEMWLPVMDSKNKAMKSLPYTYTVRDFNTKQLVEKTVEAFSMFDVNKTVMRCLVKNLAMFGLGIYIYAGDDLPEPSDSEIADWLAAIDACSDLEELKSVYMKSAASVGTVQKIIDAASIKKASLK
jgi:hypothetical protein